MSADNIRAYRRHLAFQKIKIEFGAEYLVQILESVHGDFEAPIICLIYLRVALGVNFFIYFVYLCFSFLVVFIEFGASSVCLADKHGLSLNGFVPDEIF